MKIIKIYLKGESTKILDSFTTPSGEIINLGSTRSVAVPSKKNQRTPIVNKHTGKTFLKSSDQYIKWKKLTKGFWEQEYWKLYNDKVRLPIVRCRINILFYFADDKSRDCTNKAETIMDALVEHQILADDNFKVVGDVSLKGFLCKDRPRTEVYITILEPGEEGYEYDLTNYERFKELTSKRRSAAYNFKKLSSKMP